MAALQPDPCALLPFSAGQLTPMQAIEARHAVRSYTDEPLAPEAVEALREAIARHLYRFRGMAVAPEQIVIGAGTEYLYQLLIQLLGRNRIYGIENPGYQKLAQVYDRNDVQFRYLELDGEGLSLEALRRSEVQIVHTSPSHHFSHGHCDAHQEKAGAFGLGVGG